MPRRDSLYNCIICGRPSETVVCMRCFFQYEPQTYDTPREEYSTGPEIQKNGRESGLPAGVWDEEIDNGSQPQRMEELIHPNPPTVKQSVVSWLSRLPRFS